MLTSNSPVALYLLFGEAGIYKKSLKPVLSKEGVVG